MKTYLVIGISAEDELLITSDHIELRDENDLETAQKAIQEFAGFKIDRILIVENEGFGPAPLVVNDEMTREE